MRGIRTHRSSLRQAAAVVTLVLAGVGWPVAIGASVKPLALSSPQVFGWGFNSPHGVSSDGTHVWVANNLGNSVTELDASNGAVVQVLGGKKYRFAGPNSISSDGTDVWVANRTGASVTELDASTGALVRVLTGGIGSPYNFYYPESISSDGTHVWVATGDNSVTELDVSTGNVVQVLKGKATASTTLRASSRMGATCGSPISRLNLPAVTV